MAVVMFGSSNKHTLFLPVVVLLLLALNVLTAQGQTAVRGATAVQRSTAVQGATTDSCIFPYSSCDPYSNIPCCGGASYGGVNYVCDRFGQCVPPYCYYTYGRCNPSGDIKCCGDPSVQCDSKSGQCLPPQPACDPLDGLCDTKPFSKKCCGGAGYYCEPFTADTTSDTRGVCKSPMCYYEYSRCDPNSTIKCCGEPGFVCDSSSGQCLPPQPNCYPLNTKCDPNSTMKCCGLSDYENVCKGGQCVKGTTSSYCYSSGYDSDCDPNSNIKCCSGVCHNSTRQCLSKQATCYPLHGRCDSKMKCCGGKSYVCEKGKCVSKPTPSTYCYPDWSLCVPDSAITCCKNKGFVCSKGGQCVPP